jgi:hypothetical protein
MAIIHISKELAQVLEKIAQRENHSLDEVAEMILQEHFSKDIEESETPSKQENPLDAIMGLLDDDVTDMSTTVKETLHEYYKNKQWKS